MSAPLFPTPLNPSPDGKPCEDNKKGGLCINTMIDIYNYPSYVRHGIDSKTRTFFSYVQYCPYYTQSSQCPRKDMIHNSARRDTNGVSEFNKNLESHTEDISIGITVQLT
ncbi:MAG: hypothetical protein AVO38_07365 [delta proteobacterium ML8_D]|nr:MAG: hypothetical protein AVO38_07365 [delta proteobacterium ML8_D]